ncbi:hypothetical protein E3P91_01325, partial [Wallemia ichthyophaga]
MAVIAIGLRAAPQVILITRYAIPILLNAVVLFGLARMYISPPDPQPSRKRYRRVWLFVITQSVLFTYFADLLASFLHFFIFKSVYRNPVIYEHWLALVVHCIGASAAYAFGSLAIAYAVQKNKNICSYVQSFYIISVILELSLLITWIDYLKFYSDTKHLPAIEYAHIAIQSLRVICLAIGSALLVCGVTTTFVRYDSHGNAAPGENSPLLNDSIQYGATSEDTTDTTDTTSDDATHDAKDKSPSAGMGAFMKRMYQLGDVLWPRGSPRLQTLAFFCLVLLLVGRYINLLVPIQLGKVVEDLSSYSSPWKHLIIYIALRFFQGSGGLLQVVQNIAWIPITQWTDRNMSTHCFTHLLNLSLAFHTHRKTGEILRILDKGQALNNFFQMLLFSIFPTVADICVALGYFYFKFGGVLSLIIASVMFLYGYISVLITRWRTAQRRDYVAKDNITRAIYTDALLNYDTIKYFTAEAHEISRYTTAFKNFQAVEKKVIASLYLLNMAQNVIIVSGIAAGTAVVCAGVAQGRSDAAELVVFLTFLQQLYVPLNNLGMIYRSINTSLVDSEKLMQLLSEHTDINDKPNAVAFHTRQPLIKFDRVGFRYDSSGYALDNLSFQVPTGQTVALVGESGSGKSTILRLLYRFYDVDAGSITINGVDLRDMQQHALRRLIAIIPQDCALFNESIAFNLKYGKDDATDAEIVSAAKAAQMHERILSFQDGYDTRVGERGVRLSGGEKQRIAIARALLKDAPILCLDEATSALDTNTEREIQAAFNELSQGRTTIIIAHRLSTIAKSDLILFVQDGRVVESGSHSHLLSLNGMFAAMWKKQVEGETEDGDHLPKLLKDCSYCSGVKCSRCSNCGKCTSKKCTCAKKGNEDDHSSSDSDSGSDEDDDEEKDTRKPTQRHQEKVDEKGKQPADRDYREYKRTYNGKVTGKIDGEFDYSLKFSTKLIDVLESPKVDKKQPNAKQSREDHGKVDVNYKKFDQPHVDVEQPDVKQPREDHGKVDVNYKKVDQPHVDVKQPDVKQSREDHGK